MKKINYLFFCLVATASLGWGYTLYPPPEEFVAERLVSFRVISEQEIELGALPDYPKVVWLSHSLSTEKSRLDDINLLRPGRKIDQYAQYKQDTLGSLNELTVNFIALRSGKIQLPPIPAKIGGKSILINLPELLAHENLLGKDYTKFRVTYNGEPKPPKVVRVGSHLDFNILEYIRIDRGNRHFTVPDMKVDNIEWLLFHRQTSMLMGDPRFRPAGGFGSQRYRSQLFKERMVEIDGIFYEERSFQCRGFFSIAGEAKGPVFASLGVRLHSKLHIEEFSVQVEPLPPKSVSGFDTGLIGDWGFEVNVSSHQLKVGESFTVSVYVSGTGDHLTLRPLDFSSVGFSSVSKESEELNKFASNWGMRFDQVLVPTGEAAEFPEISLANFDIKSDQWVNHKLSERLPVLGANPTTKLNLTPVVNLGTTVGRPIWLNLSPWVFALFALAPLLPFVALGITKALSVRNPEKARRRKWKDRLVKQLQRESCRQSVVDDEVLPLLKEHFSMPQGVTARELADSIKDKHPVLAEMLEQHAKASFSSTVAHIDLKQLSKQLAKLTFIFICLAGVVQASDSEKLDVMHRAAEAFEAERFDEAENFYREASLQHPDRPAIFLNLTKTHIATGNFFRARASCYTTLLMQPTNGEARKLMNEILQKVGKPALPGSSLFSARPDQYVTIAAVVWFFAFLVFLFWRNRWFMAGTIFLALIIAGFGLWRNSNVYKNNQYMVVTKELPREIEKGVPDWNFPSFDSGEIVYPAELTDTHARITATSGDSFWLPLSELEQVW